MSLTRLALAFAPAAALFFCWAWIEQRPASRGALLLSVIEAGVATLLAALWFGSLGAGGWANLFLVLGLLVGIAKRGPAIVLQFSAPGYQSLGLLVDMARYLAGGALLAWRLG